MICQPPPVENILSPNPSLFVVCELIFFPWWDFKEEGGVFAAIKEDPAKLLHYNHPLNLGKV